MKYTKYIHVILFCFFLQKFNAQQWNGLTLVSVYGQLNSTLVDTNGVTVNTWTLNGPNGYSAYMIPGGNMFRTVLEAAVITPTIGGMTGRIQKVSYNSTLLWEYSYNSALGILHHDFAVLPNGNVLATAYDVKTGTAIAAAGSISTQTILMSERIIELQPVGNNSANIVWEWKMWDHLAQNTNSLSGNYYTSIVNHPELYDINYLLQSDFCHMNGIDYNPVLDQIVFSSRYRSEWYVIDHSTTTAEAATHTGGNAGKGGDFLYRWGNPTVYQAAAPQICNVTHDPHWITEGVPNAGSLVGFNNGGQTVPSLKSTIDRIVTPRTNYTYSINLGSAFTPTTYNSRYVTTTYNIITGNSEQFPNGNQAICLGTSGIVYEVDALGNILWSYNTGGITAQAHRYSPCITNTVTLAQPTISVSGQNLISTPAAFYQWYYNGNAIPSATNQILVCNIGQNGNYLVRVSDVNSCALYYSQSKSFSPAPTGFIDLSNSEKNILIYPNPSNGIFYLNSEQFSKNFVVEVYDIDGSLILKQHNSASINLSQFDNGIYFVQITDENFRSSKKVVIQK